MMEGKSLKTLFTIIKSMVREYYLFIKIFLIQIWVNFASVIINKSIHLIGFSSEQDVNHIPFTWGTSWNDVIVSLADKNRLSNDERNKKYQFKFIIASDILLYVR